MADKPNDTKKKVEEHEENLSDSDSSDIECETCGVSFTSVKNYGAHMQGKKHLKKVAEAKLKAKNDSKQKTDREQDDATEEDDDEDSEQLHCEVCDKYFTGYITYASHIKGSQHAKNLKKEKLKKQLKDMPEVIHDEKDDDDENDDLLLKPYAKCATCQKQFSGPESFKAHMKSATHQKKVKQSGALQKLKSELHGGSDDEDDAFYKKCDTCQKSFSGVMPYKTHMASNVHKKNLLRKKVAEEMKEFCVNEDGYVCKECKKSFTDPLAFKSHLENNSHDKLKAKEALKELLNAHREIQFVIPFSKDGEGSGGDDSDNEDSKYYLICKLCHVSFSGPESAQDHVKSKKHLSTKKEKEMMMLLKEQKKAITELKTKSDAVSSTTNENDSASANAASAEGKSKNGHAYTVDDFEMI